MRWLALALGLLGAVVALWFVLLPYVIVVGSAYANHPAPNNSPNQLALVEAYKDIYYPLGRPLNVLGVSASLLAFLGSILSVLTRRFGLLLMFVTTLLLAWWGVQLLYQSTHFGVFLGVVPLLIATGLAYKSRSREPVA